MAERSIASVLKTEEPRGSVGSNPTPSSIAQHTLFEHLQHQHWTDEIQDWKKTKYHNPTWMPSLKAIPRRYKVKQIQHQSYHLVRPFLSQWTYEYEDLLEENKNHLCPQFWVWWKVFFKPFKDFYNSREDTLYCFKILDDKKTVGFIFWDSLFTNHIILASKAHADMVETIAQQWHKKRQEVQDAIDAYTDKAYSLGIVVAKQHNPKWKRDDNIYLVVAQRTPRKAKRVELHYISPTSDRLPAMRTIEQNLHKCCKSWKGYEHEVALLTLKALTDKDG